MLEELGVFHGHELERLCEIRMDAFERALEIEVAVLYDMLWEGILPAISKQLVLEKNSLGALDGMDFPEGEPWRKYIRDLGCFKADLIADARRLAGLKDELSALAARERADLLVREAVPLMESIRRKCDAAELLTSAEIWPYPIYRNLLSLSV